MAVERRGWRALEENAAEFPQRLRGLAQLGQGPSGLAHEASEFARQAEAQGRDRYAAAVEAARTRLRPILMTSFAFILGVVPLAIATGAGAEMRQSLGTAVFFGMLGVTLFGLVFTPVFYVAVRGLFARPRRERPAPVAEGPADNDP